MSAVPASMKKLESRPASAGLSRFRAAAKVVGLTAFLTRDTSYRLLGRDGRLPRRVKIAYALPQFSLTSLTIIISIYAVLFYESLGASLSRLAFGVALARSFDVLSDPLMGYLSDNTRTRFGRRRPYFIAGIGYAIAFVLLFTPPTSLGSTGLSVFFTLVHFLFYLFDTVANVPYTALGPELTTDDDDRSTLFFTQKLFGFAGTLLGAAAPALLTFLTSDKRTIFGIVSSAFSIWYLCSMANLFFTVKKERAESSLQPQVPLVPSILRSLKNQAFKPLLVGWVLDWLSLGAISALLPFFVTYVVQPSDVDTALGGALVALFLAGALSMPFWLALSRKIGKRNAWLAYNALNSITNLTFFLVGKGDTALLIALSGINGIGLGGQFLIDSILCDVIDYSEALDGTRQEASFTTFSTLLPKLVSVPASVLPLALLSVIGFVPSVNGDPQPQSSGVILYLRMMFILLPALSTMLALFIKAKYFPLKNKEICEKVAEVIELHLQGKPGIDPVTGRSLTILRLNAHETKIAYHLECFSGKDLLRILKTNDASFLVARCKTYVVLSVGVMVLFGASVLGTLHLLDNDNLGWLPSFLVIFVGLGLCSAGFNNLRRKSASSLVSDPASPKLLRRIIYFKGLGQMGGNAMKETPVDMDVEEDLAHAQDEISEGPLLARALESFPNFFRTADCEENEDLTRELSFEPELRAIISAEPSRSSSPLSSPRHLPSTLSDRSLKLPMKEVDVHQKGPKSPDNGWTSPKAKGE